MIDALNPEEKGIDQDIEELVSRLGKLSLTPAPSPSDLDKKLRLLKDFCSTMGKTVNTHKTKVMIIKSKKDTYANFMYDNNNFEEVYSYKYLKIDIHHKLN